MQTFTTLSNGSLEEDDLGYSGNDGSDALTYEQVITTSSSGQASASISGQGAVNGLSNASIDLEAGAAAVLTETENTVILGGDDTLTLSDTAVANTIAVSNSGNSIVDNGLGTSLTLGGSSNALNIESTDSSAGTAAIDGTNDVLEFDSLASGNIVFAGGASGTLKLDFAEGFSGTVAGLADGDSIDLANFLFSGTPAISSVTGSGAAGTATDVTVTDGSQSVTLVLLNQFANQFGVDASAYALTADSTAGGSGTLFQLAAAH